jgi:hypothetical protein
MPLTFRPAPEGDDGRRAALVVINGKLKYQGCHPQ